VPEPGRVKTRLIPAVGAERAASIYRKLVERVVATVAAVTRPGLSAWALVEPGSGLDEAAHWLGEGLRYVAQSKGDLGDRLESAFRQAFDEGASRVVAIGTDCMELTPDLLSQAFERLGDRDAVLGPAEDGGYYLIGLSRPVADLFTDIPWSTAETAAVTRARLSSASARTHELPTLRDVDTPEDLRAAGLDDRAP
jgi:rSAM/selenodomain-associated transferase 1